MTDVSLLERFIENVGKVSAEAFRASGADELNSLVWRIVGEDAAGKVSVYCPRVTEKEKAVNIPPALLTDNYVSASVCVEEAFAAVAETGSLIWSSRSGKPVQGGLLPAHHLAIVSAEHIYESFEDLFAALGPNLPTNITVESGPSRTADIELTLTVGVHGPERLTIIVV